MPTLVTPLSHLETSTASAGSLQRQNQQLQLGHQTSASCKIAIAAKRDHVRTQGPVLDFTDGREPVGMAAISRKKHFSTSQPPTCSREEVASLQLSKEFIPRFTPI